MASLETHMPGSGICGLGIHRLEIRVGTDDACSFGYRELVCANQDRHGLLEGLECPSEESMGLKLLQPDVVNVASHALQ